MATQDDQDATKAHKATGLGTEEQQAETVLRLFQFERILDEDTRSKTLNLLGKIDSQPAIIIAERTAFDSSKPDFISTVSDLRVLGKNDIYHWFLCSSRSSTSSHNRYHHPDVKFTLIYPATETHVQKYSRQNLRVVSETPEVYREYVKEYVESKRGNGRLNWVYNILDRGAEKEKIVYEDGDDRTGFLLLPDLKWDRTTMSALYMTAIVRTHDITSIRDLKKKHIPWLKSMNTKIKTAIVSKYPTVEADQIKVYAHYHPSYYHFHLHAVAVSHDGGLGQAAGKAMLLGNIINLLEMMAGGDETGLEEATFDIIIGEESELWQNIFSKVKGTV